MIKKYLSDKEIQNNLICYFGFLVFAFIGIVYGNEIKNNSTFLRIWEFENLAWICLGIPFLFLQTKAGIPNFLDHSIANKQRFLIPILIGAVFGILDVFVLKIGMHPEPYTELPPYLQSFPYSIFLYFSGAFEIEVFYRLIPLTLFLIFGKWYAKGKFFTTFMWIGVVLTSVREPLEQLPNEPFWLIIYSFSTGFLMNFIQAIYFQKAGFLASLTIRLGHYLFWHILLGIYVQFVEL